MPLRQIPEALGTDGRYHPLLLDSFGALVVSGGGGGGGGSLIAVATSLPPSYVEGSSDALSMDLAGNLRTIFAGGSLTSIIDPVAVTQSGLWNVGVTGSVAVTGTFWQATQPVSAASLPLPTGAATETTLSEMSGKLPTTLGQKTMANSLAVVLASDQSAVSISGTVAATQSGAWNIGSLASITNPVAVTQSGVWNVNTTVSSITSITNPVAVTQSGAWNVGVNNFPATQAVTQSGTWTLSSITNPIAVTGTFWQATQPVSAASLPLPTGAAQDSTLTGGTQKTQVVNGANILAIDGSGRPTVNINGTVPVSGSFWQATQPVSSTQLPAALDGSGNLKVAVQGTLSATQAGTWNITSITNPVAVTGTFWQATQPVSIAAIVATSSAQLPAALDGSGYLKVHEQGTANVSVQNATLAVTQSGTWTLSSITNPVAVTNANLDVALSTRLADATFTGRINTLGQKTMANSTPVVLASDQSSIPVASATATANTPVRTNAASTNLSVDIQGYLRSRLRAESTVGDIVSVPRMNQIEVNFSTGFDATVITNTSSGGGSATTANGQAVYATGTATTARATGITVGTLLYRPGHDWYAYFTAAFTTPTNANSFQRIGPFSTTDGFYVGYEGTTLSFSRRSASSDTQVAKASWNGDPLDGSAGSAFTSQGTPVAYDPTKINIYRIQGAWFGVASVSLEILSPDGEWVTAHTFRFANAQTTPYTATTTFNMTVDVSKSASDASNLQIVTPCWALGTTDINARISDTITDNTLAQMTRSVIMGKTTGGGGGYVAVKVNPSGALAVDASGTTVPISAVSLPLPTGAATETTLAGMSAKLPAALGQTTMAGSLAVTVASNQSAIPASQSGTWNIGTLSSITNPVAVTGTFWQATQPISAVSLPLPTGAAQDSTVSTMSGKLPATLGQKTMANSMAVVVASDQSAIPVKDAPTSGSAVTSVAGSATNVNLLAANTSRRGATIYNESTAILYLKLGATASATSYTIQVAASGYYEVPFGYTGQIDGLWASATGNARITEIT